MARAHWGGHPWLVLLCAYAWGHPKSLDQRDDVRNCSISPPYLPVTAVNTTARLTALRQQMYTQNLSAYIVPDTDAHMSEYIGEYDQRRVWITGFTGSAGVAVVTMAKASLWTDSRYWTQAERQMDCNWELHKEVGTTPVVTWLLAEIPVGARVGVDPFLFSIDSWESYDVALQDYDRELVSITVNLVDLVWGSERPPVPNEPIYALQEAFTGSTWQEKVAGIRSQMQKHPEAPTAVLLSALDETAWLFNLRGSDIPYNPFFYSYTLLTDSSIRLFANKSRFSSETLQYLNSGCTGPLCVQVEDYSQVRDSVQAYTSGDVKVWIGTSYTSYGLYEVIPKEKLLADAYSPVMVTKAVKNSKEQTLLRASHVRDAVAVIRYLVWLEKNVPQGTVDEFSGAEQLEKFRGEEDFFSGSSFETISASGLNAALAHYSPTKELHRKLSSDEMYLLDSGGQYCAQPEHLDVIAMHTTSMQSCLTLCDHMDCSPPGSSVRGILQARILDGLPHSPPEDLPDPGIEPTSLMSPALTDGFSNTSTTWEAPLQNTGVGCHALLQGIFPTQESNPGLLHGRRILFQLSYQESPR
ncbi:xaa-Pro aminopeptidase 2 isoform X2 [Odocoileus virginianus]|uniref:Xaa-Pro aminopeptidase 2 isoform X2 n=1 Tax=Odocoileus virginianus TaxID=9874 RepID=A0ABM4HS63_ODOVR